MLALLALASPAAGQDNEDCFACHDIEGVDFERDGRTLSLYVDPERYEEGIHGVLDCITCHYELDGVEEYPHATGLERVDCTTCHDDDAGPVTAYRGSVHGLLAAEGNELAPLCQDCHGYHDIVPLSEPDSRIAPHRVGQSCVQCHDEGQVVQRTYDLSDDEARTRFADRIHSRGLFEQGLVVTATCTTCHTGHAVLPPDDPASTLHVDNVNGTCTQCHARAPEVHEDIVAADLWDAEPPLLCIDCHAPHADVSVRTRAGLADADCLSCHASPEIATGPEQQSLVVSAAEHARSVHGRSGVSCAQCHAGVAPSADRPCATIERAVRCDTCHAGEVRDYDFGIHGRLHAEDDENAPTCVDCHGTHGVLEHALDDSMSAEVRALVRRSPTFPRNVPELCGRCHRDGAPAAERYTGVQEHVLESYSMSIHGKGLLESGLTVTAVCSDCHTAHRELPANDPESTVHGSNVAATCGRCHDGISEVFETSAHAVAGNPDYEQEPGMPELPHCNDCHSSHGMARTDLPGFQLGIMDQCGTCHAEITETYFETYHGKASALGDTARAKCHDCHGAHDIYANGDLRSSLHPANIVSTCATCHPGAHPSFTEYLTHADHHDRERYPALFYSFWGMTGLLIAVFAFFGLHTLAWLPRSWKLKKQHKAELAAIPSEAKQYMRFSRFARILHVTVILTFFGLAITGMMLKFSSHAWARGLAAMVGGIEGAGFIHRLCAIATFGYMAVHLWDVARRFRKSEKNLKQYFLGPDSLVPKFSDVRDFIATIRWFAGRGPMPRYGRWTYWEKFDYFAVFWGVVIIGVSGLLLWFPVFFTKLIPGWTINVATIIHSDEALLAVGFIFTIHFFNTHLRPEKFPMDPVIFTGRMRLKELKLERPEHYAKLVETGELEARLVEPASPGFTTAARIFGYGALFTGVVLIVLIIYSLLI